MKSPKTYFQKYNKQGFLAGREAVSASHPVLKELIGIINEQQNQHYTERKEVDLFKYGTIWIKEELFNRIERKYYFKLNKGIPDDLVETKLVTFYVDSKPWAIHFRKEQNRDGDIVEIEKAFEEKLRKEKEQAESKSEENETTDKPNNDMVH